MIWLFDRDQETIRLHTFYDNDRKEFVATVKWSDGREEQRRFDRITAFRDWLQSFEVALEEDRFRQQGPPVVLPEGWPDTPLT
jgi:hypothetical protein